MSKLIISGGNRLYGKVKNESAKNSVLPLLACSLLSDSPTTILDCPDIEDVKVLTEILKYINVKCQIKNGDITVDSSNIKPKLIPTKLTKKLRSSIFLLGALLAKTGSACLALPGGCNIGKRPIDIHLDSLTKLGIFCKVEEDVITCKVDEYLGGKITLPFASVGATENLIMCATLFDKTTIISNCAREPEIVDLGNFINKMGGKVIGAGSEEITVHGVKKLNGITFKPISDRIEFGTYALALANCGGEMEIYGSNIQNILPLHNKFCDNACKIKVNNDIIYLQCDRLRTPMSFATGPYPMFPTDLQAQTMAVNCIAKGISVVKEGVFENRFSHVQDFVKMGAKVKTRQNVAIISGVDMLHGEKVVAKDLRGGAALVIAGLGAEGTTVIEDVYHIDRGYAQIEHKLKKLGACIRRER